MDQSETSERNGDVTAAPATAGSWLVQHAISIIAVAAVVIFVCVKLDPMTVALVAVGLGLVIFIHELGHFLAAKWCDVHVETFSIGFGPPLPGCRFQKGETTYQIALVPLGGYVKMVGEGNEEDGEDDPRSFKNKTVGQRMLIISAGVIMNIILAAACFVGVYRTAGVESIAGVIGSVDAGSPAWQKGLRPGSHLTKIGTWGDPLFEDVMPEVTCWRLGKPMPIEYNEFENGRAKGIRTEILTRKIKQVGRPQIGIGPANSTTLIPQNRKNVPPSEPDSPAASAEPPLQNGDQVVGATDPDHPDKLTDLAPDPRQPNSDRKDYFDLARRMSRLAGRDIVLLVRRAGMPADAPPEPIRIPPGFQTDYGFQLGMGPITAIRENSPAARAGVQPRSGQESGDTIIAVEVADDDGTIHRYTNNPDPKPADKLVVEPLDPGRLPAQLRTWAVRRANGSKTVKLTINRKSGHNEHGQDVDMSLTWDDSWRDQASHSQGFGSPQAIDGLGFAYVVKTQVDSVRPDSPAAKAVVAKDGSVPKDSVYPLRNGDVIKSVRFYSINDGVLEPSKQLIDLELDQGAFALYMAEEIKSVRQLGLVVQRGENETVEVKLLGVEDTSRPLETRGILFEPDSRLEKADTLGQALYMGGRRTWRSIFRIYQSLVAMANGNISFTKNASGPLDIAAVSYNIAGESLTQFILFIGMISVNLAVINFLPIPVLDGGHMVFLIYEKLRGRPAPEPIRVAATFVGLAMIGSLMLFVIFLDVQKRL